MKVLLAVISSSIAAVLAQPLTFLLWFTLPTAIAGFDTSLRELGPAAVFSTFYTMASILLFGIPLSLVLWRVRYFRWWPIMLAGAVAGGALGAIEFPGGVPGYSFGGNWHYSVPTGGWLPRLLSVLTFALHGMVSATAYYVAWVLVLRPNNSFKPMPIRGAT